VASEYADPGVLLRTIAGEAKYLGGELNSLLAALADPSPDAGFDGSLDRVAARLRAAPLGRSVDFVLRPFRWGGVHGRRGMLVYLQATVDQATLEFVMERLADAPVRTDAVFDDAAVPAPVQAHAAPAWTDVMQHVSAGHPVLFLDKQAPPWALDLSAFPALSVARPMTEVSIKGPQDGFTGTLTTDIALLRRYVRSGDLRVEQILVGKRTRTPVAICYLNRLAQPALVRAIRGRLRRIPVASALEGNQVQAYLRSEGLSLVPLARTAERVNEAARAVSQGRVVVMVENDPFAIFLPAVLADFYSTEQDYQFTFWEASYVRLIRIVSLLISLYLPAVYVALTSVNINLVPPTFALILAGSREGLPFPPVVETVLMVLTIEILREASLRLPQPMAAGIGTVGGIVLGTAAVRAGIVSPQMVVVVTLTALALFTAPDFAITPTWRILLWVFVAAAYVLGVYGVMLGTVGLVAYLARVTSLGVPYLMPAGPIIVRDLSGALLRGPLWHRPFRPVRAQPQDLTREASGGEPDPGRPLADLRLPRRW